MPGPNLLMPGSIVMGGPVNYVAGTLNNEAIRNASRDWYITCIELKL